KRRVGNVKIVRRHGRSPDKIAVAAPVRKRRADALQQPADRRGAVIPRARGPWKRRVLPAFAVDRGQKLAEPFFTGAAVRRMQSIIRRLQKFALPSTGNELPLD